MKVESFGLALMLVAVGSPTWAQNCFQDVVRRPSPFLGNHGEMVVLGSGTIWEVVGSYEYLYEYYPSVIVCPQQGFLAVKDKKIGISYMGKLERQAPRK